MAQEKRNPRKREKDVEHNVIEAINLDHLRERLGAALLESLDERLVWCEGSERAAHVSIDDLETVDIAGVDPSKSVVPIVSTPRTLKSWSTEVARVATYPSFATPLKSSPWLPYSASTLCGSMGLVTSYFSTTTPLKSTKALVIMNSHL